jgi:palmitoyl-protein thioesterase
MGDSCNSPRSIGYLTQTIKDLLPGIFVHSICTGSTPESDIASTYFGNVNDQVATVCSQLASLPQLHPHGYTALGLSQGGQFLRAVVQRCQHTGPKAKVLVTLGAQHQGVFDVPGCWEPDEDLDNISHSSRNGPSYWCRAMQELVDKGAFLPWVRENIVQAQYLKPYNDLEKYRALNPFLPDINNESSSPSSSSSSSSFHQETIKKGRNTTTGTNANYTKAYYADNLASLDKLVLIQFDQDITVVPRESSHFGFYNGQRIIPLRESELYKHDRIGLRRLDEDGRLVMEHYDAGHMHIGMDWFEKMVLLRHLAVKVGEGEEGEQK